MQKRQTLVLMSLLTCLEDGRKPHLGWNHRTQYKQTHTDTETELQSQSHNCVTLHPVCLPARTSRTSSKTAASEKPPFKNTRTSVAEPRERCEPEYLDLDAEGRSVCRLVEDRICQVGETQSAAAVDVHHLVTAPRWTKRNLSSFVCSAR